MATRTTKRTVLRRLPRSEMKAIRGGTLESPNLPGVTVTIPAGVHVNVPIGAVDTIPSQLPDEVAPSRVFSFGPQGAFFTRPGEPLPTAPCTDRADPACLRVEVTFPNLDRRAPGTIVPIYAPSFAQGPFIVIGQGKVNDDATLIRFNVGVLTVFGL